MVDLEYNSAFVKNFVKNKEFNLGSCCLGENEMSTSEEYQLVAQSAKAVVTHECASRSNAFSMYRGLKNVVEHSHSNDTNILWKELSTAFLLMTWYALRLLRAPWRKSNYKIKAFNGNYQYMICKHLPDEVAVSLLQRLGYVYDRTRQTYVFRCDGSKFTRWKGAVVDAGLEFFLIHVKCLMKSQQSCSDFSAENIPFLIENSPSSQPSTQDVKDSRKPRDAVINHRNLPSYISDQSMKSGYCKKSKTTLSKSFSSPVDEGCRDQTGDEVQPRGAADQQPERNLKNRSQANIHSPREATLDNYVQVHPVHPGGRVESGYYSEWGAAPISRLKDLRIGHSERKQAAMKPPSSGDYVRFHPTPRPPVEGSFARDQHHYYEIDRDDLHLSASSVTKQ